MPGLSISLFELIDLVLVRNTRRYRTHADVFLVVLFLFLSDFLTVQKTWKRAAAEVSGKSGCVDVLGVSLLPDVVLAC